MAGFEHKDEYLKCGDCETQCELGRKFVHLITEQRKLLSTGSMLLGADDDRFEEFFDDIPEISQGLSLHATKKIVANELSYFDQEIRDVQGEIEARGLACRGLLNNWANQQDNVV